MKELSTEQKAKAYDEALKELREHFLPTTDGTPVSGISRRQIEDIFPELAESEDERIIKNIISWLKNIDGQTIPINDYNVAIAWLEKEVDKVKYTVYNPEDFVLVKAKDYKPTDKGEQKPNFCHHEVDLSNCSEEYRKAYYDGWNNCNMQHSQCKSELDDVLKCLINGMKFYYEDNKDATWGTDKWSMPVKHIIEVLEKQDV